MHREFSVMIYKRGRERALAEGRRRYGEKQKGYGGQKKPRQKRFAKTTKKVVLKLICKDCGYICHREGVRLKRAKLEE
jgi:large subunit ribosomal protein L44e